jgi:hypothetical protein
MLTESLDKLKRELLKLGCYQSMAILSPLPLLVNVSFFDISGDKSPSIDLTSWIKTVEDNLKLKGGPVDAVVVNNCQGEESYPSSALLVHVGDILLGQVYILVLPLIVALVGQSLHELVLAGGVSRQWHEMKL